MKNFFTLTFSLLLISQLGFSQQQHNPETLSFKKIAKEKSTKLHEEYPKVADASFKSVNTAAERHKLVDQAWHDLWHSFTKYYHDKGLHFKKKRRLYVHLHFSETGHLDYFGYHFKGRENKKTQRFVELFKEYIKDHNFAVAEGVKFSQCGEIHLLPRDKGIKEGL